MLSSANQITHFNDLEQVVRLGTYSDSPKLLYRYLELGKDYASACEYEFRSDAYDRLFNTLLDAIADPLVETHWRQLCLDNIYRPLGELEKLADTDPAFEKLRQRYTELCLLANYNLEGIHNGE